jgi:hypothetical protein
LLFLVLGLVGPGRRIDIITAPYLSGKSWGRAGGQDTALPFKAQKYFYALQSLTIFRPDRVDEIKSLQFFSKYVNRHVRFIDGISFVSMKREKINPI